MLISLVDNKYSSELQIFKIYIPKGSKLRLFIKHFCFFFNRSPHKMEYLVNYRHWYLVVINKYSRFGAMQPRSPRRSCCLRHLPSILTRKERELKMRSRNGILSAGRKAGPGERTGGFGLLVLLQFASNPTYYFYCSVCRTQSSWHIKHTFLLFATQHLVTSI